MSGTKSASVNDDEGWDECLLLKLNANTARWLAQSPLNTEDDRKRLHAILDAVHGPCANVDSQMQLVQEDQAGETSATDHDVPETHLKKRWLTEKDV